MEDAKPINPQRVFRELSPLLPDDCILTSTAMRIRSTSSRQAQSKYGTTGFRQRPKPELATARLGHPQHIGSNTNYLFL
jgi:hypothetical protein